MEEANVQGLIYKLHWRQSLFFPQQKQGDEKGNYYFKEKEKEEVYYWITLVCNYPLFVFLKIFYWIHFYILK